MALSCDNNGNITVSPSDMQIDELKRRRLEDFCNEPLPNEESCGMKTDDDEDCR